MTLRSKIADAAIALTALAGLAACATDDVGGRPVAATGPAVSAPASADPASTETAEPQSAPIPAPTVVKTQNWVKIFSGPSATPIIGAPDRGRGTNVVELNGTASDVIGTYVADGRGMTLYRFDNDSAKPPTSTCNGDCAKTWPPVLIKSPGKIYPSGVNPKIVGYVERADGTCQVTIGGWPVYRFAKDQRPGDILGQNVKGTWFAVRPNGGKTRGSAGLTDAG